MTAKKVGTTARVDLVAAQGHSRHPRGGQGVSPMASAPPHAQRTRSSKPVRGRNI